VIEKGKLLVQIEVAKRALSKARTLIDIQNIRSKAEALRALGATAKDSALITLATEVKLRAERRLGEMLREMKEQGVIKQGGDRRGKNQPREGSSLKTPVTLDELNISYDLSSKAQKIAAIPESRFEETIRTAKQEKRELTRQAVERLIPRESKPPPDLFQFLAENINKVQMLTNYLRDISAIEIKAILMESAHYDKQTFAEFREALAVLVDEANKLIENTEEAEQEPAASGHGFYDDTVAAMSALGEGKISNARAEQIFSSQKTRLRKLITKREK